MHQCGFVIKTWRCINRVVSWQEAARRSVFIEASAIAHDSIIIITLNVTIYLHNLLLPDSTNFIHIDNKELIKAKLLHSIGIQLLFSFVLVPEKVHVTLIFLYQNCWYEIVIKWQKKKAISFFENCSFLCGSISLMYVFLVIAARNHTNYDHHIPFVVDTMKC